MEISLAKARKNRHIGFYFNRGRSISTYTGVYLLFDGVDDLIDASPLVLILRTALNHTKALQNVDDVVNAPALNAELLRALVQV